VARIDNGGTAQLSATTVIDSFIIASGTGTAGTAELRPGTWLICGGAATSYVGRGGAGTLRIQGGAQLDLMGQLVVGQSNGGVGLVDQTGGFVTIQGSERVYLGYDAGATGTWNISEGSLTVGGHLAIGENGTGILNQTGGVVSANNLRLGYHDGTGTYTMGGASTLTVNDDAYIGDNGTGTFTQSGGYVRIENDLQFGRNPGSHGTFNISGGTMDATDSLHVGLDGTGIVVQTGGDVLVDDNLYVGYGGGSDGQYTISGAGSQLIVQDLVSIGRNGSGTFTMSGGTVDIGDNLEIGYPGTGIFIQTGGTVTIGSGDDINMGEGSAGHGTYEISGATSTLDVGDDLTIGHRDQGTGVFIQSGGTVTVNDDFRVGFEDDAVGTFTMTGGTLSAGGSMLVGNEGGTTGTATISGPTTQVTIGGESTVGYDGIGTLTLSDGASLDLGGNRLYIGRDTSGAGTMNVSGAGTQYTSTNHLAVGDNGLGVLNQTDGTVQCQNLRVAYHSGAGTFNMGGGTLTVNSDATIGDNGTGMFRQSDGAVTTGGHLYVGQNSGANGTYEMSGGTLDVGDRMRVGWAGTGVFTQTGGTVQIANNRDVELGSRTGGHGTYEISGAASQLILTGSSGDIAVGHEQQGVGVFRQSGGSVSTQGEFRMGQNSNNTGLYELSGGTATARRIFAGKSGDGTIVQTGGTLSATDWFSVGDEANGDGTYDLGGGSLTTRLYYVGRLGTGEVNQTGGTITVTGSNLYMADQVGARATYNLSGASSQILIPNNNMYVGYRDLCAFTQTGGTVDVAGELRVGGHGTGDGTYDISGAATQLIVGRESAVGYSGTGVLSLSDGATMTLSNRLYIGRNNNSSGTVTVSGAATQLTTNNHLAVGSNGTGVFNLNDGQVQAQNLRVGYQGNGDGTFNMDGGQLTINDDATIGDNSQGEFTQTDGSFSVVDDLLIGNHTGVVGRYTTSGGSVTAEDLVVGPSGQGYVSVLGSAATITVTDDFSQNDLSTLRAAIHNEGISRVNVAGSATISSGAMLDVDIWGGVLFAAPGATYEIMRTATAGNISGAYTVVDVEPIWTVIQDGTVVAATVVPTLPAATVHPGGGFAITINGGAGSVTDMLPIQGLHPGEMTWLAIDLVDLLGNDLSPAEVADIADKMIEAGQDVQTSGWVLDAHPGYDLFFESPAPAAALNFGWDFSDYDPNVAIARVRAGIPEPATLSLLGLGIAALAARRRRRQA